MIIIKKETKIKILCYTILVMFMKKIKNFINENKEFIISISIFMIGQAFLYWILKLFQSNPRYLYFALDDRIPFLGHFIYIYNIYYPFSFIAFYLLYKSDKNNYYKGLTSCIIGCLISDIIFLFMPTIMYRPVNPNIDSFTNLVINITFFFDNPPLNCFPSTHCIFCFQIIYSYIFSKHKIKVKLPIIIISFLIVLSTLLVKQHFIYDVIASLLICLITNLINEILNIHKYIKKKFTSILIIKKSSSH